MQTSEINSVGNLVRPDTQALKAKEQGPEESGCCNKEKFDDVLEKLKGMTDSNK
jgi:hypothetical protein